MFTRTARARYDVAICMYHDQALIPLKTLDMDHGVNVTLDCRSCVRHPTTAPRMISRARVPPIRPV